MGEVLHPPLPKKNRKFRQRKFFFLLLWKTGKKMGYRYRIFFFLLLMTRKEVYPLLPPSADEKGRASSVLFTGVEQNTRRSV